MLGNLVKGVSYGFHGLFPHRRFCLPEIAAAIDHQDEDDSHPIPRIIWQTNYTDKVALPVKVNYDVNRHFAREYEFRLLCHEARDRYMSENADERTCHAYSRLTDGAAQADLWRLVTLYREGGIYLDIDACLVRPLYSFLEKKKQLFICSHADHVTNYMMATVPGNPIFRDAIQKVVDNIELSPEQRRGMSVFDITGPRAIRAVLPGYDYISVPRAEICLTGVFVNEHFQYLDRPGTKWIHKKSFVQDAG